MSGALPGARTRLACILGSPVAHSLSPAMHNAAFAASGLDWTFLAFDVPAPALADAVAGLRALGVAGANVTMPHKQSIVPLLDEIAPSARRAGAVNTIVADGGRLVGANTDGAGFVRFLERDLGLTLGGLVVHIVGAGGAARGLAAALGPAGATLTVSARDLDAARRVAAVAGSGAVAAARSLGEPNPPDADVLVSAVPAAASDALPDDLVASARVFVDLSYEPPVTPAMERALAAGAEAHNGVGMLLHQAVLAFELWTGIPAPEDAMSAALVTALGHDRRRPG